MCSRRGARKRQELLPVESERNLFATSYPVNPLFALPGHESEGNVLKNESVANMKRTKGAILDGSMSGAVHLFDSRIVTYPNQSARTSAHRDIESRLPPLGHMFKRAADGSLQFCRVIHLLAVAAKGLGDLVVVGRG